MLATIRDDTWNVLNMQHKSQIRKDGIIQTFPVVAINIQAYWWNGKINDTHITGLVNAFRWGWIQYKVHITRQIWGIWKLQPAYSRGVTIRRATIRYVSRYVGRDTTNDTISDDTPTN